MEFLTEHWPAAAFILGMVILLLLARILLREPPPPYEKRDGLVTDAELRFYHVLTESASEDYTIFAMVRMADLLRVREETQKRQSWQNKINQKHIDFVLCDPESLEPQLAIELDDRSHQRADRQRRDEFVNEAMSAASLPLLRVKVKKDYDADGLRHDIDTAIDRAAA